IWNCSVSQLLMPTCCTCAISALVGPKAACSRKRAAARLAVPSPAPGFGGPTMFAVAVPVADGLATLVPRMVTAAGFAMAPGAVYRPAAEIVPAVELPPAVPLTLQVTAVFVELATVAVNCADAPGATVTLDGDTLTVTGGGAGGCTVTVAEPVADGLTALV